MAPAPAACAEASSWRAMDVDACASSSDSDQDPRCTAGRAASCLSRCGLAAASAEAARLPGALADWVSQFGATKPFDQHSAEELMAALRAACAADAAPCVQLLLRTAAELLRSCDCALAGVAAAAAAGSPAALVAALSSPELSRLAAWRGPRAPAMLADTLAGALRASLAAAAPPASRAACFNSLLAALSDPSNPAAAARPALAPHARGLLVAAAEAGARGALQALLVALPEHCECLDAAALEAARARGHCDVAADIALLLQLRAPQHARGVGPEAAAAAAAAAGPEDMSVVIDTPAPPSLGGASSWGTSSCASPLAPRHPAARKAAAAAAAAAARGAAARGSFSSVPSSCGGGGGSEWGGSSRASSCCGYDEAGVVGELDISRPRDCRPPAPAAPASPGADCWSRHPAMCGGAAAAAAKPPAAPHAPPPPSPPAGAGVCGTLLRAVRSDDVAAAARLLTRLVEEQGALPPLPAGSDSASPLEAFILDLLAAAGAAGAGDCAHLLLTAVGGNDDAALKPRAAAALLLAAASAGRGALVQAAAEAHPWVRGELAAPRRGANAGSPLACEVAAVALRAGHRGAAAAVAGCLPCGAPVRRAAEALIAAAGAPAPAQQPLHAAVHAR
ncbi:hypothetical protein Rsub_00697 [Raphidocelis subcapitata]|uniref:Uncharacterized protein n=1 Tax=Raphidocelis subcapitata TaxID=307507 RepID=A0A2V0NT21_9CHLO|nr:hypothetical protein Rsub_00697 [Raphidocelis subcapitata]|eukprot:GBF87985.1 hypothetical protein Rsub_00697 [Raphidocelis subcapitata]